MNTKNFKIISLQSIILISISLFSIVCNKDSNPNNSQNSNLGNGSSYFPMSDFLQMKGKATLQTTSYNAQGNVVGTEVFDQVVRGFIGSSVNDNGYIFRPLYGYDQNGNPTDGGNGRVFVTTTDGKSILGVPRSTNGRPFTILPTDIKVGNTWVPNPYDPIPKQSSPKIEAFLSNYTNSSGKSYSNVIKISIKYSLVDSSFSHLNKESGEGYIYFAKGVGLVDIKVVKYEIIHSYYWGYYERKVTTGTVSRTE